jgi:hypothetical protein
MRTITPEKPFRCGFDTIRCGMRMAHVTRPGFMPNYPTADARRTSRCSPFSVDSMGPAVRAGERAMTETRAQLAGNHDAVIAVIAAQHQPPRRSGQVSEFAFTAGISVGLIVAGQRLSAPEAMPVA